jgi:hypothetical protein
MDITMVKSNKQKLYLCNVNKLMLNNVGLLFVLTICLFLTFPVNAQKDSNSTLSLKQLLIMPGDLTAPHAKIESDCQQCHLHFDKESQSPLCLDCHKEINDDMDTSRGFHSKIAKDKISQCQSCHTDHKGRDFDITSLDKEHFNHSNTEFSLENSHQRLDCNDCHKATDKNFRIKLKKGKCASCHDDPHQGELNNKCTQCHNDKSWQQTTFDHNDTQFLLKGKHENLACQSCHVNDVSVEVGGECLNCHLSKDKHLNTFGNKCQSCHSETGWENTEYDHFKETQFRLVGKHQQLSCDSCHLTVDLPYQSARKKLGESCFDCHQKDDLHLGNNGQKCQQCHNNTDWAKTSFNHNKETNFALQGAHKSLHCDSCHLPDLQKLIKKTSLTKKTNTLNDTRTCYDCHQIIDDHDGKLGKECQNCHQQQKWHEQLTFNHDFTSFPLTGAHQLQMCQSCHFSSDYVIEKFSCVNCHQDDDVHELSFGKECATCHNSASWGSWNFDHQEQTDYPLEGAHSNLACGLCHQTTFEKTLSPTSTCVSCHQQDDIHQGTFGNKCQKCHKMESFYDFKH